MRRAISYSIVDHKLLHGGYFSRLDHQALALYLFLLVVGDCEGKSYYAEKTIMEKLNFTGNELSEARKQLIKERLIDFRSPYWWVKNIEITNINKGNQPQKLSSNRSEKSEITINRSANTEFKPARPEFIKKCLESIFNSQLDIEEKKKC